MVGVGLLMLALVALGWGCASRGRLYDSDWFLRALMWSAPLGFIAVVAGWTTTEVGRQPWTVYGVMRTAHSVTPSLTGMRRAAFAAGLYRGLCHHVSRRAVVGARASCAAASPGDDDSAGGGGPSRRAGQAGAGRRAMILDFVPIWTLILGAGGVLLCAAGRFRSGRRHSLQFRQDHAPTRNLLMNSIAPIWDGNETWLVLGGIGLAGGLSAGLRHHPARGLFPHPGDAAGAGLSRRGV